MSNFDALISLEGARTAILDVTHRSAIAAQAKSQNFAEEAVYFAFVAQQPMGRLAHTAEIAAVAVDDSGFTAGTTRRSRRRLVELSHDPVPPRNFST